jgi:predicted dehydrogenase
VTSAKLRWSVAGHGDVVRRRALPAFAQAGQDVVCLWGRDRDRAAAAARALGVPRATADFASALAEADAVYVATPVATHVPLVRAALRAGRHVLAEKPLGGALDYDRAELLALAEAAGATTGVAYYRRFTPLVGYLRESLGGRGPVQVAIRFAAPFDPAESDPMHWRTVQAHSGGGVLTDAGSHRLDLLCLLFGPPAVLRAELAGRFPGGAERRARVDLAWRGGTAAKLDLEWRDGPAVDEMTIDGPGRRWDIPAFDEGAVVQAEDGHSVSLSLPPTGNPLVPVVTDFASAVAGRRPAGCPLADAMLVDDLLRAAGDGGRRSPP